MNEKKFQAQVIQLATLFGWTAYHPFDSRRSSAGFPDLVFAKPKHQLILAELKSGKGKLSAAQEKWIDILALVPGIRIFIWRPADLEEIAKILEE